MPPTGLAGLAGIRIHRAHAGSGLSRLGLGDRAPYWAYPWGGGMALASYILAHPSVVAGRRIMDLGTGSGLVAIAAARAGAATVCAVDVDSIAIIAAELNAANNGAAITVLCADLLDGKPPDTDLILVGDLFYEASLANRVTAYLDRCRAAGIDILVGDPWRADLPLHRLHRLADLDVPDYADPRSTAPSAVFHYGGT